MIYNNNNKRNSHNILQFKYNSRQCGAKFKYLFNCSRGELDTESLVLFPFYCFPSPCLSNFPATFSFPFPSLFPLVTFEICLWNLPNWRVANWNWILLLIRLDLTHTLSLPFPSSLSLSLCLSFYHTLQRLQRQVASSLRADVFFLAQTVSQI